jgi:hypothetical protein
MNIDTAIYSLERMLRAANEVSQDKEGKSPTMQSFEAGYITGIRKALNLIKVHSESTEGIKSS